MPNRDTQTVPGQPLRALASAALVAGLAALSACGLPQAHGDANSVIIGATGTLWEEVRDTVFSALEPTILTVRDERTFELTHQDPADSLWLTLRRWRQVVVMGDREDPWVAQALDEVDEEDLPPPGASPAVLEAEDVWARDQNVTILVLSGADEADEVIQLLDSLHEILDLRFRTWVRGRMFATGPDTALSDTLRRTAGFDLLLPNVYYWDQLDSIYVFRNDYPSADELIRSVAVTWRTPPPEELDRETLLEWREEVSQRVYEPPQVLDTSFIRVTPIRHGDREAYQVQAVWSNPPEGWPAGGPFITRAIRCEGQDRTYLLDAWLYAPGKDKYEYMIQLFTILDSFECGGSAGG